MKKIQSLGKTLSNEDQRKIVGGVLGACSVTLACPEEYGGGSVTCSGTEGRCHRNFVLYYVQCDTDPNVSCLY